jgi:methylmalonyl-CoA mutase cobalamin-binding subunit
VGASLRGAPAPLGSEDVSAHLDLIRRHDAPGLRAALTRLLSRFGVGRFVIEVVAPLNVAVGDAWLRGHLQVFEEHMYTEVMQAVLRQAVVGIPALPVPGRPRVLLTTFPGEQHGLGLLMAEAVLALEGCACISLGVQTPLWDIVLATKAFGTDIVALSFTGSSHPNQVADGLAELRAKLPPSVAVWAGGSSPVLIRRRVQGVLHLDALDELADALEDWRARSGPR